MKMGESSNRLGPRSSTARGRKRHSTRGNDIMTATTPATAARPVDDNVGKALGTDEFLLKAGHTVKT
jgi:hypothetical protein